MPRRGECIRSMNQDNFSCNSVFMDVGGKGCSFPISGEGASNKSFALGLFDGMGGEECGEIASYIAAKEASELIIGKDPAAELLHFCQVANQKICDYARENSVHSMGTTAAVLAFGKREITLCNIGDSKIYRFSDGNLVQISKDHVSVAAFGRKPPLSQSLGIPPEELIIEPYVAQGAYRSGDSYLICSDGLTDMVDEEEIAAILRDETPSNAADTLVERALANGGRDNITVILAKIQSKPYWLFSRKKSKKEGKKNDK